MDRSFEQIKDDVEKVLTMNEAGKTIRDMQEELGLPEDYLKIILACGQGFIEDDNIAVARLVEMSL